jgi:hypothetical protein
MPADDPFFQRTDDPWIERIMAAEDAASESEDAAADRRAAILRAKRGPKVAPIAREALRALGKFTHHNGGM